MALEQKLKGIHQALQEDFGTGKEQDTVPSSEKKAHEESSPQRRKNRYPFLRKILKVRKTIYKPLKTQPKNLLLLLRERLTKKMIIRMTS